MRVSHKAIRVITHFESKRNYAYNDPVGICTVGVGHALKPHRRCTGADYERYGSSRNPKMSDEHVERILRRDLAVFEAGVTKLVRAATKQHEFDALVCLAFNIGLGAFAASSVLKYHNRRLGFLAGRSFMLWTKGTINGQLVELPGLVHRRKSERYLYRRNAVIYYFQ